MTIDWFYTTHFLKNWLRLEDGVAAIEGAMLFPPMVALLLGVYDIGTGIILNERTVTASQICADLITRDKTVNMGDVNEAIMGARLAYEPYGLNGFGIDVVSVTFDAQRRPQVLWRETRGMNANNNALDNVSGIGAPGEGMVIVTVQYTYEPLFGRYFTEPFKMIEIAYARGRRSPTVKWEG